MSGYTICRFCGWVDNKRRTGEHEPVLCPDCGSPLVCSMGVLVSGSPGRDPAIGGFEEGFIMRKLVEEVAV
jgi:hypothetical protein